MPLFKINRVALYRSVCFALSIIIFSVTPMAEAKPPKDGDGFTRPMRAKKGRWAEGQILVIPRAGVSDAQVDAVVKKRGGKKARRLGKHRLRVVEVAAGDEEAMIERLRQDKDVEFAELDREVFFNATNDPAYGSQWHLPKIGADAAWSLSRGQNVVVAIADTGVDPTHPDLKDRLVAGYNFYDNNTDSRDVRSRHE